MRRWSFALLTCLPLAAQEPAPESARYVEVDYRKVERRIGKPPAALVDPRYALLVLDLAGTNRCWAVTDRSAKDAPFHDVLYLDLDSDGDLTEPGERFAGQHKPDGKAAGLEMAFRIPELRVPGTDLVHKDFLLSTAPKQDRTGFWFRLRWNGRHELSGGYGPLGMNTTAWGDSPANAPILRPCPFGVLRFATWGDQRLSGIAGSAIHVNVIVGNPGSGPDTMMVVDEHFLDLKKDELTVTVIARDAAGKEVRETSRIAAHC